MELYLLVCLHHAFFFLYPKLSSFYHSRRFSEDHGFDKPNDEQALYLMNACAVSMLQEFPDIVFAYGVSDEYRCNVCFFDLLCPSYELEYTDNMYVECILNPF